MKLGIIPARGTGLEDVMRSGQRVRFLKEYEGYRTQFDEVFYFDQTVKRFSKRMPQCDVLRVLNLTGVFPALIAQAWWGVPFVLHVGFDHAAVARILGKPIKARAYRLLRKVALNRADAVIAHAKHLLSDDEWTDSKMHFIPNGVDLEVFRPQASPPTQWQSVLYVGRDSPEKNLGRFYAAMAKLPHARLDVVGTPPVPYEQLPAIYRRASCFVLPSLVEGCPKVLLEAMACFTPCVVSDRVQGIGRRGITHVGFDPLNVEDLRDAIELMLDKRFAEQTAQTALAYVRTYHDLIHTLQKEVDVVVAVCAKSR